MATDAAYCFAWLIIIEYSLFRKRRQDEKLLQQKIAAGTAGVEEIAKSTRNLKKQKSNEAAVLKLMLTAIKKYRGYVEGITVFFVVGNLFITVVNMYFFHAKDFTNEMIVLRISEVHRAGLLLVTFGFVFYVGNPRVMEKNRANVYISWFGVSFGGGGDGCNYMCHFICRHMSLTHLLYRPTWLHREIFYMSSPSWHFCQPQSTQCN